MTRACCACRSSSTALNYRRLHVRRARWRARCVTEETRNNLRAGGWRDYEDERKEAGTPVIVAFKSAGSALHTARPAAEAASVSRLMLGFGAELRRTMAAPALNVAVEGC